MEWRNYLFEKPLKFGRTRSHLTKEESKLYFKNRIANHILSFLVSVITNINFSDVETGYKLIKSGILKNLNISENSFAIEIEITMKLSKKKLKFFEVGISYNGRTFEEGKKIKMLDGFIALYKIFYYAFKK